MADFETDIIDIPQDTIDKNNPTANTDGGTSGGSANNTLTQDDINNLGKNQTSTSIKGYYFESQDGKFKAQVLRTDDGSGRIINALKLKGTDTSGKAVNRLYEIPSARNANDTSATYRVFECQIVGGTARTEATFYNGGKLTLKLQNSSGTDYTLTLALKGKYLNSDGTTIDKIG